MRAFLRLTSVAVGLVAGAAGIASGCASGNDQKSSHGLGGGSGQGGNVLSGGGGPGGSGGSLNMGGNGQTGGGPSCAKFTDQAKSLPAAMMIVLDGSASMNTKVNGTAKWDSARQAIAEAIDNDALDNTSLGILIFPDHKLPSPTCLTEVGGPAMCSCGYPAAPQVLLADSGTSKSTDPSGVRHDIRTYLNTTSPLSSSDDGSPDYEALQGAYSALQAYAGVDKRIAVLVSDGGFSCTSKSSPVRSGYTDGACPDWEEPDSVNALISGVYGDANAPVNTFIVGVPGSHTAGGMSGLFANAPYHMLLALSTYAVSGSPETVDPTCDHGLSFTKTGPDPLSPCHIDLSNGSMFSAGVLAQAIAKIRGQALGCTYDLPTPPPGQTIDTNLVNVIVTVSGQKSTLPRRSDKSDTCLSAGCWDYNATQQVQLLGKGCSDVSSDPTAKVEIEVGCKTIVK